MGLGREFCAVADCGRSLVGGGYQHCRMHRRRQLRGNPTVGPLGSPGTSEVLYTCRRCGVEWCRLPGARRQPTYCSEACKNPPIPEPVDGAVAARNAAIVTGSEAGVTRPRLAAHHGLSVQRIDQILAETRARMSGG